MRWRCSKSSMNNVGMFEDRDSARAKSNKAPFQVMKFKQGREKDLPFIISRLWSAAFLQQLALPLPI